MQATPSSSSNFHAIHDNVGSAHPIRYNNAPELAPEVISNEPPEVAPSDALEVASSVPTYSEKELAPYSYAVPPEKEALQHTPQRRLWRRKRFILLLILAICLILAAILGGVLGSRAANNGSEADTAPVAPASPTSSELSTSSTPTTTSSSSSTAASTTPTVDPSSINSRSILAAASWHNMDNEEDHSFVAYQRHDGRVQVSRYVKTFISDDGFWGGPHTVEMEARLEERSALAMSQLLMNGTSYIDLTCIETSSNLNGQVFDTGSEWNELEVRQDRELRKEVAQGSNVAAFGIMMVFQEVSGELTLRRRYGNDARWNTGPFSDEPLEMLNGTQLAVVPLSANYTKVYNDQAVAVFYQDRRGRLRPEIHSEALEFPRSWPSEFPEIEMAPGGSFAALSVQRSPNSELVNTFVLYQDESSAIQMLWTDGSGEWNTSTPDILQGADEGTSIACTTPDNLDDEDWWILGSGTAMTRCYYFEDGNLVKVQLEGRDWVNKEMVRVD